VDGSVVADRFLWDKVSGKMIQGTLGSKKQERRLKTDGGVEIKPVEDARQGVFSLSDVQVGQLAKLVISVEKTYEMPMDMEWAYTAGGELKVLQARPITTIHPLEEKMITPAGQRRMLYFDCNVVSEATTTAPFTPMDIFLNDKFLGFMINCRGFQTPTDPKMAVFTGSCRYYINVSHFLKFFRPVRIANAYETLDPYVSSIAMSSDCSREKYRTKKLPKEISCCNMFYYLRNFPLCKWLREYNKYSSKPAESKQLLTVKLQAYLTDLEAMEKQGATDGGLQRYLNQLLVAYEQIFLPDMAAVMALVNIFDKLNVTRVSGKTEQDRQDADDLLGGFDGDDTMESNIAMYHLARKLPVSTWDNYDGQLGELAKRIDANLKGEASDLPKEFLDAWCSFMHRYGWDGENQLFVSSPRYADSPETLLARMQHNSSDFAKNPDVVLKEKASKRRDVMARHLAAASVGCFSMVAGSARKIRKRNAILEEFGCLRNGPKLHIARMYAVFRKSALKMQDKLLLNGRLDEKGDIFMLLPEEIDQGMDNPSYDFRAIVAQRKACYNRIKTAKACPLFIDSRCRILKPDIVEGKPGTLVGAAISPGVATGRVRIMTSPTETMEKGEVLATVVTDPSWTPLFAGAAAIILQVGGALQHGALCAREFGKPAISSIDVMRDLRTGMLVRVDGNTGVLEVLDSNAD
jgi:pyruvate,water dikinase